MQRSAHDLFLGIVQTALGTEENYKVSHCGIFLVLSASAIKVWTDNICMNYQAGRGLIGLPSRDTAQYNTMQF